MRRKGRGWGQTKISVQDVRDYSTPQGAAMANEEMRRLQFQIENLTSVSGQTAGETAATPTLSTPARTIDDTKPLSGYSGIAQAEWATTVLDYYNHVIGEKKKIQILKFYSSPLAMTSMVKVYNEFRLSGVSGNPDYKNLSGVNEADIYLKTYFDPMDMFNIVSGWILTDFEDWVKQFSGFSGFVGPSGYSGFSGYSFSGYSGFSGQDGVSVSGASGYSGFSYSGFSGFSGQDSTVPGPQGESGYSGFSGQAQPEWATTVLDGAGNVIGDVKEIQILKYGNDTHMMTGEIKVYNEFRLSGVSGNPDYKNLSGVNEADIYLKTYFDPHDMHDVVSGWLSGWQNSGVFSGESGYSGFSGQNGGADGVNVETLTEDKFLTAGDARYQMLSLSPDTGGATVFLPDTDVPAGKIFTITNCEPVTSEKSIWPYTDHPSGYIRDGIYTGSQAEFIYYDSNWHNVNPLTAMLIPGYTECFVNIGHSNKMVNGGIAIGRWCNVSGGNSSSVAIGDQATCEGNGVAVGFGLAAGSCGCSGAGVALGFWDWSYNDSIAIGRNISAADNSIVLSNGTPTNPQHIISGYNGAFMVHQNSRCGMYGEFVWSHVQFDHAGDAEVRECIMITETTVSGREEEFFLDGISGSERLWMPEHSYWTADLRVLAHEAPGGRSGRYGERDCYFDSYNESGYADFAGADFRNGVNIYPVSGTLRSAVSGNTIRIYAKSITDVRTRYMIHAKIFQLGYDYPIPT